MSYRQIDLVGIFTGDARAIAIFRKAFEVDCNSDRETFLRIYRWKPESLERALTF